MAGGFKQLRAKSDKIFLETLPCKEKDMMIILWNHIYIRQSLCVHKAKNTFINQSSTFYLSCSINNFCLDATTEAGIFLNDSTYFMPECQVPWILKICLRSLVLLHSPNCLSGKHGFQCMGGPFVKLIIWPFHYSIGKHMLFCLFDCLKYVIIV